jgi:hypothetical protein
VVESDRPQLVTGAAWRSGIAAYKGKRFVHQPRCRVPGEDRLNAKHRATPWIGTPMKIIGWIIAIIFLIGLAVVLGLGKLIF